MNDPQEKNTQNPYHIYYDNYLDTNACTDRYPGSEDTNEKTVCCMYDSRPFPFCGRLQQ